MVDLRTMFRAETGKMPTYLLDQPPPPHQTPGELCDTTLSGANRGFTPVLWLAVSVYI